MHKIIVAVEDSPVDGVAEGGRSLTVDVSAKNPIFDAPNVRLSPFSPREMVVSTEPIFGSFREHVLLHANVNVGFLLSVDEMIGGPSLELTHATSLMPLKDHVYEKK